jgi:solute carrier family 13 (sodium-dependent dicarboxylate transporter), member 2/3/5
MLATAFLSMWVSNTATAVMMLPIGLSVIGLLAREGTARPAASPRAAARHRLCGEHRRLATLIGTPPNALLAAFMARTYGVEIGFAQWMAIGLPITAVMLVAAWLILTRLAFRCRRVRRSRARRS